jgi:single-stranded DNA-binding protein
MISKVIKTQLRSYYNKVTLVGRLGKDPQFYEFKPEHQTSNVVGKWIFNIVTKKSYKDPSTAQWIDNVTWHHVHTTRDMKSIGQGSMVLVEGELKSFKDNNDQYKTYIMGSKVVILQGKDQGVPPEANQ